MLYEIILNWNALKFALAPSNFEEDLEFLIVFIAFLTLGARYSSKLSQMLDEAVQMMPKADHSLYMQQWRNSGRIYIASLTLVYYFAQKKYLSEVELMVKFF
jgi:hypothetical protein